jgi:hypothetical protein
MSQTSYQTRGKHELSSAHLYTFQNPLASLTVLFNIGQDAFSDRPICTGKVGIDLLERGLHDDQLVDADASRTPAAAPT